jgi:hypothetical protein
MDSDPIGDKVDHTVVISAATTDPIYQLSPESGSKGSGEVYMVQNREELPEKTVKEIQRETDVELIMQPIWPGRLKEERGTTTYRMTRLRRKMSQGMVLP